jgi:plastocyanin
MPGPSWRPFLGAFGLFAVMLGLVFGEWVLAAGIIALISTLVGWLVDALAEYRQTVKADTTGHLENIPEPKSPRRLLSVLTVLIVGAAVLQSGVFVGSSANGGTGAPGASGGPSGSGGPAGSGAPAGSGGPPASAATADVSVEAKGVAYVQTTWTGPAGKPFTIAFDNEDAGTPHNIEILDGSGATVFKGDIFPGVATKIYQVPALPAGSYKFLCIVHPTIMTGTATIK